MSRRLSTPLPASGWGEGPQERQKPETSIQGNGEKGPGWTLKGERRPAHVHALLYCMPACLAAQLCPTLCDLMDCNPPGSSVHGILQAKNTGVGCHFLLRIFLTQGSNWVSCIGRRILYHLSHQGSPSPSLNVLSAQLGHLLGLRPRTIPWAGAAWGWELASDTPSCRAGARQASSFSGKQQSSASGSTCNRARGSPGLIFPRRNRPLGLPLQPN